MAKWTNANAYTRLNVVFATGSGGIKIKMAALPGNVAAGWNPNNPAETTYDAQQYVTSTTFYLTSNTDVLSTKDGADYFFTHELGHYFGLGDTNKTDGKSVMNGAIGKNDSGGGTRHQGPSICDAAAASQARNHGNYVGLPGTCPPQGCLGFYPWPNPCGHYSPWDGWYFPEGSQGPVSFPHVPPMTTSIPPGIALTQPANGAVLSGSAVIKVATGDADGRVMLVTYYVNGVATYTTAGHPFEWHVNLSGVAPGTYNLYAVAKDNSGLTAQTNTRTFTVTSGGGGGGGNPTGPSLLNPDQRLYSGQSLWSSNGQYRLSYQSDGNLVLYSTGSPYWATMEFATPGYLEMQGDGNLVAYASNGVPYWASMTFANGANLNLQTDSNAVIYAQGPYRFA